MLLYKFRSFEKFEFLVDLLLNQRLHCADYKDLNDPCEGFFILRDAPQRGSNPPGLPVDLFPDRIVAISDTMFGNMSNHIPNRICCLSAAYSDLKMWTHYASDHTGVAIEIEIPDSNLLHIVNYNKDFPVVVYSRNFSPSSVREVLTNKLEDWVYEQEYRLITNDEFFSIKNNIKAVYFGIRAEEKRKDMLKKLFPEISFKNTRLNPKSKKIEAIP